MTIKDIAASAGVSVSTVSRVLNHHPDVSEEARSRVLRAIEEHHYVPNSSARDLVRVRSDAIGLVLRGISNSFFSELVPLMEEMILEAGFTPVLHQIPSGRDELAAGAQLARAKRLRGLILMGGSFDYSPDRVASLGVPFVLCTYTNSFGTLRPDQYSSVTIDDELTGYRATKTLLDLGHRRVAVVLDSADDRSISQLRYLGYRKALEEAGVPFDPALVVETVTFDMEGAFRGMDRLLRSGTDFSAVFAVSDTMALAAIRALHEAGRSVPRDCSVVGIDGLPLTNYTIPVLTTLVQPQQELARASTGILLDLIQGRGDNRQLLLEASLRRGESAARLEQSFASSDVKI